VKKTGPARWGDTLAPGIAVAALALLVGFISLPLLSLVIWTVNALLLSIRTTAVTMAIILVVGTPAAYVLAGQIFRACGWRIPWWISRRSCPRAPLA
jgi:hypothetical protein